MNETNETMKWIPYNGEVLEGPRVLRLTGGSLTAWKMRCVHGDGVTHYIMLPELEEVER